MAAKVTEGGENDKLSVKELFDDVTIRGKLLVMGRGFYSETNMNMFEKNILIIEIIRIPVLRILAW